MSNIFPLTLKKEKIGIGRRKEATARVFLFAGTGELFINQRFGLQYLQFNNAYLTKIFAPLKLLNLNKKFNIVALTNGGGLMGQTEAIKLGVARLLCKINPISHPVLKYAGFLTRDPRVVERKKYGLKKARKASQYSKR